MSMTDYRLMGHHTDALRLTAELIKKRIWTKLTDFTVRANVTKEPLPFARRKEGKLRTFRLGDVWGDTFDCAWFFMSAVVPESAAGKVLYARVDVSGEALLVDGDGNPLKGFTSVTSGKTLTLGDFGKTIWPVNARPGEKVELTFDAGNNDLFGKNRGGRIIEAGLYACDTEMRALYYDYAVLFDLMCACDERYSWYHKIRRALTEAERRLDRFDADEVAACRRILAPLLSVRSAETGFELSVLGHAHLDLAWTWPVRETIRKGARTFATALAHMETYPDYIFGASQAQLYEWMRCNYPQLFERIRRRVEEGRWELQGGMWVECDLNIPCGEALVRQFLYGQAFFRQHFGRKAEVCWLPDSFGFTGALPQLIRGAGMSYFLTQKIRTAPHMIRYPHDTFLWKGIDGTAVLTHVAPYENYGSGGTPREIKACEERFLDKSVCDDALFLVGQGDGGGGAGAECLECYERTKDLEGLPRSRMRTAGDFFRRTDNRSLGVWCGPMELDMHTGTLTSAHGSKRRNVECETLLHALEWLTVLGVCDMPADERERIWKRVLLYQFHDILPGTSIGRVYEESWADYDEMISVLGDAVDGAMQRLADAADCADNAAVAVNAAPVPVHGYAYHAGKAYRVDAPAYSAAAATPAADSPALYAGGNVLENERLRVTFADDGEISSIVQKATGREFVNGFANRLVVYRDDLRYNEEWGMESAWDMAVRYPDRPAERPVLVRADSVREDCRVVRTHTYRYGDSEIRQRVILYADSARIEFETEADWQESGRMLRSRTEPRLHAAEATRGIQFGCVKTPVNTNTEWEYSCYEHPAQRYADISQGDCGMALLSPHKYGYRLLDGCLDVNLLRSSNFPAPGLDKGTHRFTYALYIHDGDAVTGGVVAEAYAMLYPPRVFAPGRRLTASPQMPFSVSGDVIAETVKPAEDGAGAVVRLYEPYGRGARAELLCSAPVAQTDLLEENRKPLESTDGRIRLDFAPFEIKTLYISVREAL